jgi:hypothetical protein
MQQAPTKEMLKHFVIIRLMFVSLSGRPCRDMGGRLAMGAGRPLLIYRFAVGSTFIMIGNDFF